MRASKIDVRAIGTGGVVDSWMKGVPPTGSLTTDIEGGSAIRSHVITSEGWGRGHYGTIESVRSKRGLHAKRFMDVIQSTISSPEEFARKTEYQHPLEEGMVLAALMTESDADNEEEEINEDAEVALPKIKLSIIPRPGSPEPGRPGEHRTKTSTTILYPQIIKSSRDELSVKKSQTPVAQKASHGTGENLPGMSASGPQIAAQPRPINFPLRKRLQFAPNPDSPSLIDNREERERGLKTRDLINQDIAMAITGGGNDMLGKLVLARIGALEEGMTDIKDILKKVKKLSGKSKEKERRW